jgi:hypothetical protein
VKGPPGMAKGKRESVRRVGWFRRSIESQDVLNHRGDLLLVCSPVPGNGSLDLARRVQANGEPASGGRVHRNSARLRRAHDGLEVVLREDALKGDRLRCEFVEDASDSVSDSEETLFERHVGWRSDYVDENQGCSP